MLARAVVSSRKPHERGRTFTRRASGWMHGADGFLTQHANARAESAYVLARRAASQHVANLHIPFFTLDAVIELVPTGRLWQCIFPDLAAEDEATAAAEGDAAGAVAAPADGAPAQTAGGSAQGTRQRGRGTAPPPSGAAPPPTQGPPAPDPPPQHVGGATPGPVAVEPPWRRREPPWRSRMGLFRGCCALPTANSLTIVFVGHAIATGSSGKGYSSMSFQGIARKLAQMRGVLVVVTNESRSSQRCIACGGPVSLADRVAYCHCTGGRRATQEHRATVGQHAAAHIDGHGSPSDSIPVVSHATAPATVHAASPLATYPTLDRTPILTTHSTLPARTWRNARTTKRGSG